MAEDFRVCMLVVSENLFWLQDFYPSPNMDWQTDHLFSYFVHMCKMCVQSNPVSILQVLPIRCQKPSAKHGKILEQTFFFS